MPILFIYNAKYGKVNAIIDTLHKLTKPKTYSCSLCKLTHNTFHEKRLWKNFRELNSNRFVFLHKDEFKSKYPNTDFKYPIILKLENGLLIPLLESHELKNISNVETLIKHVNSLI